MAGWSSLSPAFPEKESVFFILRVLWDLKNELRGACGGRERKEQTLVGIFKQKLSNALFKMSLTSAGDVTEGGVGDNIKKWGESESGRRNL